MVKHTIFTGCSRPALFMGVQLLVLVLSGLSTLLLTGSSSMFVSGWAAVPVTIAFVIVYFWARSITKLDEWRLAQVMQKIRLRQPHKSIQSDGGIIYKPYRLYMGDL